MTTPCQTILLLALSATFGAASVVRADDAATAARPKPSRVKEMPVSPTARLTDDLVLESMDGKPLRLAELRGQPLLIVTWASW